MLGLLALPGCMSGFACAAPGSETQSDYWVTEVVNVIGRTTGGDSMFGWVADVSVSQDGQRVYVLDGMAAEVTVWTPDGVLLDKVGGRGEGPGEFTDPVEVASRDDGFYVIDVHDAVLFRADGHVVEARSVPPQVSHRGFGLAPMGVSRHGAIVAFPRTPASVATGWLGDDPELEYPLLRISEAGGRWAVDTIVSVEATNAVLSVRLSEYDVSGWHVAQPYADSDLTAYDARRESVILVKRKDIGPGTVHIVETSDGGDTVWDRTLAFPPVHLTAEAVDEFVEAEAGALVAAWPDISVGRARQLIRGGLYVPDHYPAVDAVMTSAEGAIWLRDSGSFNDGDTVRVWYSVARDNSDAGPLRRVLLPDDFFPLDGTADVIWGVSFGMMDETYVEGRHLIEAR